MINLLNLLKNATVVKVIDFRGHCPLNNRNGGNYYEITKCFKRDGDGWEVRYYSSSDFDYCDIFGMFTRCTDCYHYDSDKGQCTASPEVVDRPISEEDLQDPLKEVEIYSDDELIFWKEAITTCGYCYEDGTVVRRCQGDD